MNLIAGATRIWSELGWWDVLLMAGVLGGVLLACWWINRGLVRKEQEEAQAQVRQRLNAIVDMHEFRGPRKAGEHATPWKQKGDVA